MGLRINHNLASLGAALNLGRANEALSHSLAKLSTGLKINKASDGPADLIISEKFRSQINSISKAVENTQNAISMLSTAEGALAEVNALLNKMQGLALKATQTGTQSPDEIAASQAEIDSALESINSISRNTAFGSVNLLDGSQSIETEGVDTDKILVDIDKANFAGNSKQLNIEVVEAAARAETTLDLTAEGQSDADGTDGILSNTQVLKITGNRGSDTITFSAGSSYLKVAEEINSRITQTGVYAEAVDSKITLKSAKYGATEFVTVEDVDGDNDLLSIEPVAAPNTADLTEKIADLTTQALGFGFDVAGVEVRTVGALGSKFEGYTVNIANGGAGVTASVNDIAKVINIIANTGATVTTIAAVLSTETGISFAATDSGAATIVAADAVDGLTMEAINADLIIKAKSGKAAATNAEGPKITIVHDGAEAISYDSDTNSLTLTLESGLVYTNLMIDSLVSSDATIDSLFEFDLINGGGRVGRTSSFTPIMFEDTSVSSSNKAVDLSTAEGMGSSFRAGGVSNFGFKLTALGEEKFSDYTVTYTGAPGTAGIPTVAIDDANKTITITANSTATVGDVLSVMSASVNCAFTNVASIATTLTVGTQGETSSGFSVDGSGLTVTARDNSDSLFDPRIVITESTGGAIAYSSAEETIYLTINADTTTIDTQAEFDALLDASATGADLRSLFDFDVTGAIVGTTVDSVRLTPGGVVVGADDSTVNTNYIKVTGTDGSLEVNGVKTAANNLRYTFDNGNIRGHITIDEAFNEAGKTSSFTLSGKGAFLQLGSKTQLSQQVGVGIQSVAVDQLATGLYLDTSLDPATTSGLSNSSLYTTATLADITSGGEFDLSANAQTAYDIISTAITEVSIARSKLGALISNTLESNVNSLGVAFENLTASESRIRDVDFAAETAEFTRAQILVQAGTSVAAQANVATQAALQLLG